MNKQPFSRLIAATIIVFGGGVTLLVRAAERNIIVFITDDESPTLGCYGDPVAVTPVTNRGSRTKSLDAPYGQKTVAEYIQRPRFGLYHIVQYPDETRNLAAEPAHAATLLEYRQKLKTLQRQYGDPWITKWDYE